MAVPGFFSLKSGRASLLEGCPALRTFPRRPFACHALPAGVVVALGESGRHFFASAFVAEMTITLARFSGSTNDESAAIRIRALHERLRPSSV